MTKLKEIIEASKIFEEGTLNESKNKFTVNSRNYSFSIYEKDDEVILEVVYKNKIAKDIQEYYAHKFAKINATLSLGGFSIDSRGQVSLYKNFSKNESTDNIAYAVIKFLQNADQFVVI